MFDDEYVDNDFLDDDYGESLKPQNKAQDQRLLANLNRLPTIGQKSGLFEDEIQPRSTSTKNKNSKLSNNKPILPPTQKANFKLDQDSEDDIDLGSDEDDEDFGDNLYFNQKSKPSININQEHKKSNLPSAPQEKEKILPSITKSNATQIKVIDHQNSQNRGANSNSKLSNHNLNNDSASSAQIKDQKYMQSDTRKYNPLNLNSYEQLSEDEFYNNESLNASKQIKSAKQQQQQIQQPQVKPSLNINSNKNASQESQSSVSKQSTQKQPIQMIDHASDSLTHGGDDEEPFKQNIKSQSNSIEGQKYLDDIKKLDPPQQFNNLNNTQSSKASNLDARRQQNSNSTINQSNQPSASAKISSRPPLNNPNNRQGASSLPATQNRDRDSDSVERMAQINEKLKQELLDVINKMEMQLKKFEEKRRAKIESELQTNTAMIDKNKKIKMGQNKFQRIKQEVQEMWAQLEHSYNIELINKLEDELKDKTNRLHQARSEIESVQKIEKEQNGALENLNRNKENSNKISNLSNQLRVQKDEYKRLKDLNLQDQKLMKQQHEQVMRLEEKCKKIQIMIKDSKNKNTTQRSNMPPMVTDLTKSRLEDEVKEMDEQRIKDEKRYKQQVGKLDQQLKQLNHELQILSIKLKEKDQEVKLNELKIRELKKQVPNTKLKPLNRKDGKVNMSVDTRLNDDFDSLIEEERAQSKRGDVSGRPKIQRRIIRDGSQKVMQKVNSAKNQINAQQQNKISSQSKSRANNRPQTITRQSSASDNKQGSKPAPKQFNIRNKKQVVRKNSNTSQVSQISKPNNDILAQLHEEDKRLNIVDQSDEIENQVNDDNDLEHHQVQAEKDDKLLHTINEEISHSQFDNFPSQMPKVKNMQGPLNKQDDIVEEEQIQDEINMGYDEDFEDPVGESRTEMHNLNLQESSIKNDFELQNKLASPSMISQKHSSEIGTGANDNITESQQDQQQNQKNVFAKPSFMMKKKR
ncbi:UNKNOWN [Stylonychia lemnae]|uniref:Lebercilin domain-containing protein n=1 Tax=Stylonychia lemnae TaxID=5949 RepID=A0A077ZZS8_STYLE|nr:UNKNOWN [Stylonychia lemnae]|eukprot:CDW74028.1 UNKNOWN [Stylonychia lemnae]